MKRLYYAVIAGLLIAVAGSVVLFTFPGNPPVPVPVPVPVTSMTDPVPETTPAIAPVASVPGTQVTTRQDTPGPTASPAHAKTIARTPTITRVPVKTLPTTATAPFPLPARPAHGDPYPLSITSLEQRVHELINRERAGEGLAALSGDPALSGIARSHSEDMAANNFFDHINPAGLDPTARGDASGYTCRKDYGSYYTYGIAENIFQNNLYTSTTYFSNGTYLYDWTSPEQIAETTVGGWMNSSGHRKNILTSTYDREGIGVAISPDDKVYITEDFC